MPNAGPGEWEGLEIQKGDRVRSVEKLTAKDYTEEGILRRRPNTEGTVGDLSNSHGLCFRVDYDDGGYGYYDLNELILIQPLKPPPKTRWERLMGTE